MSETASTSYQGVTDVTDYGDNTDYSPPPAPIKKFPGRPRSPSETPQQRVERLKAELEKANQAHKAAELNLAAIVGAMVVQHARADENYRQNLATLLRDKLKSKAELAAVAEFLA